MALHLLVRFRADADLDAVRVVVNGKAIAYRVRHHERVRTRFVRAWRCWLAAIRVILFTPPVSEGLVGVPCLEGFADDHVHLFVQCDPKHSPAYSARQFKSYSGKHLLERNPEIRESYFWGGGFWKVGYYVGTTGAVSEEVVERYIEETEHTPE